jgi:hypothetical protein
MRFAPWARDHGFVLTQDFSSWPKFGRSFGAGLLSVFKIKNHTLVILSKRFLRCEGSLHSSR